MGGIFYLAGGNVIQRTHQPAFRHFLRVLKLQGAAGGIAGIRERLVLIGLPFPVQPVEGFVGHQDLAADFKLRGPAFSRQLFRNVGNPAGVGRHVIADDAVAPGKGPEQLAVPVGQAYGRSVELELAAVRERDFQRLGGPLREFLHLADAVGVSQREHRILVRILGKA